MIVVPLISVSDLRPTRTATPATPAATRTSHHGPPKATGGAELGRRHGWQPVCDRFPAVPLVPATICLSLVPSRIVTIPATVSTCVCEHSTSTTKVSDWLASAIATVSLEVIVAATPAPLVTRTFPEERTPVMLLSVY